VREADAERAADRRGALAAAFAPDTRLALSPDARRPMLKRLIDFAVHRRVLGVLCERSLRR